MATNSNCLICGSKDSQRTFRCKRFELFRCNHCRNSWLASDERQTYEEEYYRERDAYYENYKKGWDENKYPIPAYKNIITNIKRLGYSGARLLELGCSKGLFLHLANQEGFSVFGLDISQYAINYIKANFDFTVSCSDIAGARLEDNSFDIVVMIDVIEHLERPNDVLRESYRVLRPGGLIVIDTPNEDSLINRISFFLHWASLQKIKFFVLSNHDIEHLVYFSPSGIERLLKTYSFNIVKMDFFNIDPSVRGFNWMINLCSKPVFLLAEFLRMQNKMVVFAKKSG